MSVDATIECPHCDRKLGLQGLRPGTSSPRCPYCWRGLRLQIDQDHTITVTVEDRAPDVNGLGYRRPA